MKTIFFILGLISIPFSGINAQTQAGRLSLPGDNLDLYAVMELFKDANDLEDFERRLNSEKEGINNLDLNEDGFVDYIRVLDYTNDNFHSIVLQVPFSDAENQDVAVIEIEQDARGSTVIQIVGDPALYGNSYIIEPAPVNNVRYANVSNWRTVRYIYAPTYVVYVSPWYYNYHPNWYYSWHPIVWINYHNHWNSFAWHNHSHYHHVHVYACHNAHNYYHSHHYHHSPTFHSNIAHLHKNKAAVNSQQGKYSNAHKVKPSKQGSNTMASANKRPSGSSRPSTSRPQTSTRPSGSSRPSTSRPQTSTRPSGSSRPSTSRPQTSTRPSGSSRPSTSRPQTSTRPSGSSRPSTSRPQTSTRPSGSSRPSTGGRRR